MCQRWQAYAKDFQRKIRQNRKFNLTIKFCWNWKNAIVEIYINFLSQPWLKIWWFQRMVISFLMFWRLESVFLISIKWLHGPSRDHRKLRSVVTYCRLQVKSSHLIPCLHIASVLAILSFPPNMRRWVIVFVAIQKTQDNLVSSILSFGCMYEYSQVPETEKQGCEYFWGHF